MKWISVDDELPELNKKVLVYATGQDGCIKKKYKIMIGIIRRNKFGNGFKAVSGGYKLTVTHWIPLPRKP